MRPTSGESFRVSGMGGGEHGGSHCDALLRPAVMHIIRRQEPKARMMVLGVVPGEEEVAVGSRVLDRAEPLRERRPVLQRLELRFREWVVVGYVRSRVGLGHTQVGESRRRTAGDPVCQGARLALRRHVRGLSTYSG